jgi:hypothetical protein
MKEAPSSSETSVLTRATRRNNPEDTILHSHRRENLKSYILQKAVYNTGPDLTLLRRLISTLLRIEPRLIGFQLIYYSLYRLSFRRTHLHFCADFNKTRAFSSSGASFEIFHCYFGVAKRSQVLKHALIKQQFGATSVCKLRR